MGRAAVILAAIAVAAQNAPTIDSGSAAFSVAENTLTTTTIQTYTASDADMDDLTWSLSGTDAEDFNIGETTGALTFAAVPNFEMPADEPAMGETEGDNIYNITVVVSDDETPAMTATLAVVVTVTNVNEDGAVTITGTTTGGEELTASLTDDDGTISSTTWQWSRGSMADGSDATAIDSATSATYELKAADVDKYLKATATYTDFHAANQSASAVTAQIAAGNADPTITTMTTAYNFAENTAITTAVTTFAANDTDTGDTLTWDLAGNDAGDFTITANDDGDGVLTFKASPDYETPAGSPAMMNGDADNTYEVTIRVSDSKDSTGNADTVVDATLDVVVTVTDVNEAPDITTTTGTYNFAENTAITTAVDTFAATDPDAVATLHWSLAGNDAADFSIDSGTGALTFKASPNFEDPKGTPAMGTDGDNTYEITVQVRDSLDATGMADMATDDTQAVVVTVTNVNDAPTFDTDPADFAKDENTAITEVLATYTASDEDTPAQTLTWLLEGDDRGDFAIGQTTGVLKFAAIPDFENPADAPDMGETEGDNEYEITIKVTDNGSPAKSATKAITVTVNNVNEKPEITTKEASHTAPDFAEIEFDATGTPDLVVATYAATDPDAMTTLTWSVSGTDAASFEISSSGVLSFKAKAMSSDPNRPDHENPHDVEESDMTGAVDNEYKVVVEVSDGKDDSGTDEDPKVVDASIAVVVTVTNVDETPEITTTNAATHTAPSFMEIEYDATGTPNLVVATYMARDEESETITWSVGGDDASDFSIDSMTGALSFGSSPDFETPTDRENTMKSYLAEDNKYQIIVKATDGTTAPNAVAKVRELPVTVTVTNVNERPEFTTKETTHTAPSFEEIEYHILDADLPATAKDVVTYMARDEEGESITWSLGGADMADFSIGSSSGVLSFVERPNFEMPEDSFTSPDTEGDNVYNIIVKATDGSTSVPNLANTTDLPVTVTVTDVNEAPDIEEVTGNALEFTEVDFYSADPPATVHTFAAVDYDDMDTFTWSLSGDGSVDDAEHFAIDTNTGELTFKQNDTLGFGPLPSYEEPQDADTDNVYEVTIRATDDDSTDQKSTDYAVAITVTDKEEDGAIAVVLPNDPPQVGDVITFTLSDPDAGIDATDGAINWTIQARRGTDPWVPVDTTDPASLEKTYTVDEDDTGQELRATVTYTDRWDADNMGAPNTVESDPSAAVVDTRELAPPRFRSGAEQTIDEGPGGRDTNEGITATDRDGEVPIFGIAEGDYSDLFEIIPSGETTTATIQGNDYTEYTARLAATQALDFEALDANPLFITLTLSDGMAESGGQTVYDDTVDVTYEVSITVNNVDEPGVITLTPEEAPEPGVEITAELDDPDGNVSGESWQWQRSEDAEADTPVWADITGETSNTYTPSATDDVISGGDHDGKGYYLRVKAAYTDGQGSYKNAYSTPERMGAANTPPTFSTETASRSVDENSSVNTNIGAPVAAVDPEKQSPDLHPRG